MTNETTIPNYGIEYTETYGGVGNAAMQQKRYKDSNMAMKNQKEVKNLKDEYTGRDIKRNDNANLD